jgi:hypothetical protein
MVTLKSRSNLDNFEHIHYYLNSSRFWPTVVNRATNNQANQSCINTACTVPNRSACSEDAWPWRGTEECSNVGCLMELYEKILYFSCVRNWPGPIFSAAIIMIFVSCTNINEYVRNYQDCLTLTDPPLHNSSSGPLGSFKVL